MHQYYLSRYAGAPSVIIGFHGCEKKVADRIINEGKHLQASNNVYDWLGPGIYFWEANPLRALEWAKEKNKEKQGMVPDVIGAFIDLGVCLNLLDSSGLQELKRSYDFLDKIITNMKGEMPENKMSSNGFDMFERKLDCAVVKIAHAIRSESGLQPFDTVRGVFWEGKDLYNNAGFKEKNHIQISVINPNAILGYFRPLSFSNMA